MSMYNSNSPLKVFSGRANVPLAEKIAQYLGDTLGKLTQMNFPDGEQYTPGYTVMLERSSGSKVHFRAAA